MADDNKKDGGCAGKQPASRAKKTVSSNASPQIEGQRARRFGASAERRARGAQAKRIAAGLPWVRIA